MGKRIISALLVLVMLAGMLPVTALAAGAIVASGTCGDNLTWTLDSEGTLTISGVGAMYDYKDNLDRPWASWKYSDKITSVVICNGVTRIGTRAFASCENPTSITIPDSVTSIGDYAFDCCVNLTSITIPASVTSIGNRAFNCCHSLTSVTIPDGVVTIGDFAFNYCKSLSRVTIPDSVTTIGAGAFQRCANLKAIYVDPDNMHYSSDEKNSLYNKDKTLLVQVYGTIWGWYTISNSVTVIGDYALAYYDDLTSIMIPEGVVRIGNHVFDGCKSLTSVTIPDSVTSIGDYAFHCCEKLTSVTIPNGVTAIGKGTFYGCSRLTSVKIPDGVTSIGSSAFYHCVCLAAVKIPDGVTTLGNYAFSNCNSLTSVTLPDSVTTIGAGAFSSCDSLTSVTIPDGVTAIGAHAFRYCCKLTAVTIPDSVTTIGPDAFENCESLTSISIPGGVSIIGGSAFENCFSLTSVTISAGVTHLGHAAFEGCCSLTSVTIPDSVTIIDDRVFWGCDRLNSVTFCGDAPSIGGKTFQNVTATAYYPANNPTWTESVRQNYGGILTWKPAQIDLPSHTGTCGKNLKWMLDSEGTLTISGVGPMEDYRDDSDTPWGLRKICDRITSVVIDDGVTSIGAWAFADCVNLTSITIPEGITGIGNSAFSYCYKLTAVTIPDGATTIGDYAFCFCSSLTAVTIPDSVTTIGKDAFGYCESLSAVIIPDGVTTIGDYTFRYCTNLTTVTIPDSVTTIGKGAFCGCDNLTAVTIPDSVTTISPGAFQYCYKLTAVTIPDSVTTIGKGAFQYCCELTAVTIPDSVTAIGKGTFFNCSSLASVTFCGDAPSIGGKAFQDVTATVYYPANKPTWTEEVRQNYGGNLTWKSDQAYLTPNEKGEIYFDSFKQLKRIAATNFDVMVNAKYVGKNPLVISEDLTIPYYMILDLSGCKKVTVPENVTFTVRCQLLVDNLEVNGTMSTQGMFNVGSALVVNGALTSFEIRANSDTVISGRENISFYNESGKLYRHYSIYTEQELRAAAADAEASFDDREVFVLYINPKQTLCLTNPLKIPANCQVQLNGAGMNIQKDATLTVNCEFLGVYASLTVEGMLKNNSRIEYFADYGGKMSFAGNRAYNGKGLIQIFGEALDEPGDAVSGLDMSHFHVERKEGSWQPYWELKLNHAARLEDIVHDEHKTHKEKVDDVRDMDAEELKHSMEKDKHVRDMIEKLENDAAGGKAGKKVRHEVPGIDHEGISIVGANLNSKEDNSLDVTLVIDKVEQERQITGNYDTSTAVQFSMTLDNVKDTKNLDVPVVVTIPVPAGIAADKVVVLHYHDDGTYDVINPEVSIVNGKAYAKFVLTSFSDFAILEKLAALLGDVDLNEGVDVDDVLALLWYVLFPDMYPIGDVTADFDHNGSVDVDDVLTLLWYVLFPDMYPLTPPEPVKPVMGTVTVDKLNVRTEPSTSSYPIVKQLDINTRVEILEQREVYGTIWGRIAEGWIPMNYVQLDAE